ncbi:ubiquitin carboxyl-terminal hydrolase 14 [Sesbania bispinosa]|nr:ubiquitin carboxyl-terminal hydrolase 14 [Sesbania bispinosa]
MGEKKTKANRRLYESYQQMPIKLGGKNIPKAYAHSELAPALPGLPREVPSILYIHFDEVIILGAPHNPPSRVLG